MGSRTRLVAGADGEVASDSPETSVLIKAARPDLTLTWSRYEPGESGPGPHIHRHHADCFYVLGGTVTFEAGPDLRRIEAVPGTFVAVPTGIVHTFRNEGPETAYFLNLHAPDCGFADQMRGEDSDFDSEDPPDDGGRPADDALIRLPGEPDLDGAGREQDPGRLSVSETTIEGDWRSDGLVGLWVLGGEFDVGDLTARRGDYVELEAGESIAGSGSVLVIETPA
jgi:mannose-6-phosphate isomerase-like protein (cupin superfamily)